MSEELPYGYSPEKAMRFNAKMANKLRLPTAIPDEARARFFGLMLDPRIRINQRQFADDVVRLQKHLGFPEWDRDGAYGDVTHKAAVKEFVPVEVSSRYLMFNGQRFALDHLPRTTKLVGMDDDDALDLSRDGHSKKVHTRVIYFIVVHWGGRDPWHLFRYFSGTTKSVSSHGCAGPNIIFQFFDLSRITFHAGSAKKVITTKGKKKTIRKSMNNTSIGIDVAQWADPNRLDHYKYRDGDQFDDIKKLKINPERKASGGRGFQPILSLDSRTALATKEFVFDLLEVTGLPARAPRNEDGSVNHRKLSYEELVAIADGADGAPTVIGHHHIAGGKPDIIGWWDACFHGTELA